jgi:DNA-binding FrmR family transcriptional regulator
MDLDFSKIIMQNIITRLKRVKGQIDGLVRMIEREESCEKIIVQFQAAKAALDSAFSASLNQNLAKCLKEDDSVNMEKIVKLISKK